MCHWHQSGRWQSCKGFILARDDPLLPHFANTSYITRSNRLLFCVDNQNTVPDTTSLRYYISLTKEVITKNTPPFQTRHGQKCKLTLAVERHGNPRERRTSSRHYQNQLHLETLPPEPNSVSTSSTQSNASAGADGAGFGNGGIAAGGIAGDGTDGSRSIQHVDTTGMVAGSKIVSTYALLFFFLFGAYLY